MKELCEPTSKLRFLFYSHQFNLQSNCPLCTQTIWPAARQESLITDLLGLIDYSHHWHIKIPTHSNQWSWWALVKFLTRIMSQKSSTCRHTVRYCVKGSPEPVSLDKLNSYAHPCNPTLLLLLLMTSPTHLGFYFDKASDNIQSWARTGPP